MARDYKTPPRRAGSRSSMGSFLAGLLVGLLLGLGIAVGVAWYINKLPSPFVTRTAPAKPEAQKPAEPAKAGRSEEKAKSDEKRFSFYDILPGKEEAAPPAKVATAAARETFYLQAGAFQSAADADNLKARLALLGVEAKIETAAVPEKGTWHRVRAGPFATVEQVNRARDALRQNGIETQLVRIRETTETK